MHEYSIARALLNRVGTEVEAHGATAVHRVQVRLGREAGVDMDLLRTAWELARRRTACEGAALTIELVDPVWRCPRCGAVIPPGGMLRCGECRTPGTMEQGDEIVLEHLELEVP